MTRNVATRLLGRANSGILAIAYAVVLAVLVPALAFAAPFAAYVMDARTGEVLYENNANTRLHPASLTKMMTLYVTFGAIERGEISLDSMVTVSRNAASQAPSRLGLKPGQKIALRYLIRAAAIKSANDAATAICEAVGGSQEAFARRMNKTAKAIGMTRSTFKNCNGLTADGHMSTARDMTVLGRRLFYDFPQYYSIFSRRSADAGVAQVASTNRRFLDSYEGADGIKTGYTGPAGFNLTASAQRGNKRIIATILGGQSTADRNSRMAELLDIGFGKAPNNAKVQKPLPPVYTAEADPAAEAAPDALAAAVAQDVAAGIGAKVSDDVPAAGKTIRVQVAVNTSPRPQVRPVPGTEPPPADGASVVAMADTIQNTSADTRPDPGPTFAQTASPQPETAALAAAILAEGGPATLIGAPANAPAVAFASVAPLGAGLAETAGEQPAIPSMRPKMRPETMAVANAAAPDYTADAIAAAVAEAVTGVADPAGEDTMLAAALTEGTDGEALAPLAAPADAPAITAEASGQAMPLAAPDAAGTAPAARTDQIILASVAPADTVEPEAGEIVSRISTSGGRQFGISLGRYSSRNEAERTLLRTALTEVSTLDEALRKVVERKGGYEANFVGMTQETADLACMRLQARATDCAVFGPES